MIFDNLQNAERYVALHPGFRVAFDFLLGRDLSKLATGRHEVDGDAVFALINSDPPRGHAGARLEAHRQYIDIQLLVEGSEEIGWRALADCRNLTDAYDASRDIMFFGDEPQAWITLPVGKFMIFYPEDTHAPLASNGHSLKAVMKVAV